MYQYNDISNDIYHYHIIYHYHYCILDVNNYLVSYLPPLFLLGSYSLIIEFSVYGYKYPYSGIKGDLVAYITVMCTLRH